MSQSQTLVCVCLGFYDPCEKLSVGLVHGEPSTQTLLTFFFLAFASQCRLRLSLLIMKTFKAISQMNLMLAQLLDQGSHSCFTGSRENCSMSRLLRSLWIGLRYSSFSALMRVLLGLERTLCTPSLITSALALRDQSSDPIWLFNQVWRLLMELSASPRLICQ